MCCFLLPGGFSLIAHPTRHAHSSLSLRNEKISARTHALLRIGNARDNTGDLCSVGLDQITRYAFKPAFWCQWRKAPLLMYDDHVIWSGSADELVAAFGSLQFSKKRKKFSQYEKVYKKTSEREGDVYSLEKTNLPSARSGVGNLFG